MPKTVLLVANSAYNIFHFRQALWKALIKADYRVVALAPADGFEHSLESAGITFYPLPELRPYGRFLPSELRLYYRLLSVYQALQPDVILHFTIKPNLFGSIVAKKLGLPSVVNITGLGTTWLTTSVQRRMTEALYRQCLPAASIVVVQNETDLQELQRIVARAKSWQLIPGSGIDLKHFEPQPKCTSDTFRFLYLGRMLVDKGLRELFSAWSQVSSTLPAATLDLLGEYDEAHPRCLDKASWEAGLALERVHYHRYQADVRSFIQDADVVVLPSYREGVPRSLLEALAMARPIIATNTPGCRELALPRQTGWRIPTHSVSSLADAMQAAYNTPQQTLEQFGMYGRKVVAATYDADLIAQQYLDLIRTLVR